MILQKLHLFRMIILIGFSILIVGCKTELPRQNDIIPSKTQTVLVVIESPSSTSSDPDGEPTTMASLTPSATVTVSIPAANNISSTVLPTETATTESDPLMTILEESRFLSHLMATNAGCELPCWWGIKPGETRVKDVRDYFATQGAGFWDEDSEGSYAQLVLGYAREGGIEYRPDVLLRLYPGEGEIDAIRVSVDGYQELGEQFLLDWRRFSISSVLIEYDAPSNIRFEQVPLMEPGDVMYLVALAYTDLGAEFEYKFQSEQMNDGTIRVCLDLKNTYQIDVLLYLPVTNNDPPMSFFPDANGYTSWKDLSGGNEADFLERFSDPESDLCIDLPGHK